MLKRRTELNTLSKAVGRLAGSTRERYRRIRSRVSPLSTPPNDRTEAQPPGLLVGTRSSVDSSDPNLRQVFDFTSDVVDKQYRSYVWNDGKVNALVAINGALIAGILLILQVFDQVTTLAFTLLMCAFFFSIGSFLVCLAHAVPRMSAGIGNEANLRTIIGVTRLTRDAYHARVRSLDIGEMVRMNCWQISGMSRNNMRSHKLVSVGVWLTITAVGFLAIAVPTLALANWSGATESGIQQPESLVLSQPGPDSPDVARLTTPLQSRQSDQRSAMASTPVTDIDDV